MEKQQIAKLKSLFDSIMQKTEDGIEFWCARDLQTILGYEKWDKFINVIEKAKISCENSSNLINDHFLQAGKMVTIGSGAEREILDFAPEKLPPAEDIKKLERRVKSDEKRLAKQSGKLPKEE